jgi:hypothetical protein
MQAVRRYWHMMVPFRIARDIVIQIETSASMIVVVLRNDAA